MLSENSEKVVFSANEKFRYHSARPGTCRIRPRARGKKASKRPTGETVVSEANEVAKDEKGLVCVGRLQCVWEEKTYGQL